MYLLIKNDGTTYHLPVESSKILGRKLVDIIVDDISVSRRHAEITVKNKLVYIRDLKSTGGTFVNSMQIHPGTETKVELNAEIKLGTKDTTFVLKQDKIIATQSTLDSTTKVHFKSIMKQMNYETTSNWDPKCTHVVVPELNLTRKVLCALITNQSIVNIKYFEARLKCIQRGLALPSEAAYKFTEFQHENQSKMVVNFEINRRILFNFKVFVFANETSLCRMEQVIKMAGGEAMSITKTRISDKKLNGKDVEYILVLDENHSQVFNEVFDSALLSLKAQGRRAIPIQEIAFAVLYGSTEKECNSYFNKVETLFSKNANQVPLKSVTLAPETQTQVLPKHKNANLDLVVQETNDLAGNTPFDCGKKRLQSDSSSEENLKEIIQRTKKTKLDDQGNKSQDPAPDCHKEQMGSSKKQQTLKDYFNIPTVSKIETSKEVGNDSSGNKRKQPPQKTGLLSLAQIEKQKIPQEKQSNDQNRASGSNVFTDLLQKNSKKNEDKHQANQEPQPKSKTAHQNSFTRIEESFVSSSKKPKLSKFQGASSSTSHQSSNTTIHEGSFRTGFTTQTSTERKKRGALLDIDLASQSPSKRNPTKQAFPDPFDFKMLAGPRQSDRRDNQSISSKPRKDNESNSSVSRQRRGGLLQIANDEEAMATRTRSSASRPTSSRIHLEGRNNQDDYVDGNSEGNDNDRNKKKQILHASDFEARTHDYCQIQLITLRGIMDGSNMRKMEIVKTPFIIVEKHMDLL